MTVAGDRSLGRVLTLTHDVTSPASALAVARFDRLAGQGLPVVYRGVDVLGIDATLPVTLDVLAELDRVADRAAALGVTLHRPSRRPSTARVHLVAELAEDVRRRAHTARGEGIGGVPVLAAHGTLVSPDLADDDLWELAGA